RRSVREALSPSRALTTCDFFSRDHARSDGKLMSRKPQSLARQLLRNASQLKHDPPGFDDGHPVLRRPFALAHTGLSGLFRHRLIRKDLDPDSPAAADMPGHGDTGSFDLGVGNPTGL